MKKTTKVAVIAALAGTLSLSGCGGGSGSSSADTVHIVGYSVLKEANAGVIDAFKGTAAGKDVAFDESYDASGASRDAVLNGLPASEVHLSLEPDVSKLVDAGIVAKDWKNNDTQGICTSSIVVFVVKKGNPLGIKTWQDLVDKKAQIVTPNPASSGSAKWNQLAAYGSVIADGGTADQAAAYMQKFFGDVVSLPDSGRDATTAFTSGTGDVLLSYENEAILARQSGTDFDYVVPDSSLLIQNPCALTTDAPKAAADFMAFQKSAAGQKLYAETGYRPLEGVDVGSVTVKGANDESNPFPAPAEELTIDDPTFGGWGVANDKFFNDGTSDKPIGILTDLQNKYASATN